VLVVLSAGVSTLGSDVKKFAWRSRRCSPRLCKLDSRQLCYIAAVTPAEQQKFGIGWSLKLTNEGGFVVALLVGLIIANFFPRLADWLKEAIRPSFTSRSRSSFSARRLRSPRPRG